MDPGRWSSKSFVEKQICDLEIKINLLTSTKNAEIIKDQIKSFQTPEGSFSQTGLWKLRKKLLPRQSDPPMAKKDAEGNLITNPDALKELYIQTYVDRLAHRPMKKDFEEIYEMKCLLWEERNKSFKKISSKLWTIRNIEKVTKNLKTIKPGIPLG